MLRQRLPRCRRQSRSTGLARVMPMTPMWCHGGPLKAVHKSVVLVQVEAKIANDLAQEWSDDHLATVVRDHDDLAGVITEGVVAPLTPHPLKPSHFGNSSQITIREEAQSARAATSMRQVPMNSGAGSS
jgi:hypothetical protein